MSRSWVRARWVMPVCGPMIEDGVVEIQGNRIARVDRWAALAREVAGPVMDLGESVILPGLVNAHAHLDYTHMAGKLPRPRQFVDWIQSMVAFKGHWSYSEFAASWIEGAKMLLGNGTTTVADTEAVPELVPEVWHSTPLRVVGFLELIDLEGRSRSRALVAQAAARCGAWPEAAWRAGLSPHAPYSTTPHLLKEAARVARRHRWRLATHVAESHEEFQMFTEGRGPMHDWLKGQRKEDGCGAGSPVSYLEHLGYLGPDLLAIHANYLGPGDAEVLGRLGVHVVHCPRSHAYFGHDPFPAKALMAAGVNVCLGTDSLASVISNPRESVDLSQFEEMRVLAGSGTFEPEEIVRMSTVNGARALNLEGKVGELSAGANADLVAIPDGGAGTTADVLEAVTQYGGHAHHVMIGGQWSRTPEGPSEGTSGGGRRR